MFSGRSEDGLVSRTHDVLRGMVLAAVFCVVARSGLGAGVLFDGMTWYHSQDPAGLLRVDDQGHLVWKARKPHQLVVRLKTPQRLTSEGDVAEFACWWKSSGDVLAGDCKKTRRHDDCVACLAGTGDFRIGLFDSGGRFVARDGVGLESDVFQGWRGYQWRFFPHLRPDEVKRWKEPKPDGTLESHTNLRFWKRVEPDQRSLLGSKESWSTLRYEPFAGGFDVPQGRFRRLVFRIERQSEDRVKVSLTLNGKTFFRLDEDPASQPQKIDVLAIHMPNARPYHEVVLAPASSPLVEPRPSLR
jgi:hypothetical protein